MENGHGRAPRQPRSQRRVIERITESAGYPGDDGDSLFHSTESPVFSQDERLPEVWFVRSECDHYGNRTFTVCKAPSDLGVIVDQVFRELVAVPERPWWRSWERFFARYAPKPYSERVRAAFRAAQKRAWGLNEQLAAARRLDAAMQAELSRARHHNTHDRN